jgi:hypothetical protein
MEILVGMLAGLVASVIAAGSLYFLLSIFTNMFDDDDDDDWDNHDPG